MLFFLLMIFCITVARRFDSRDLALGDACTFVGRLESVAVVAIGAALDGWHWRHTLDLNGRV